MAGGRTGSFDAQTTYGAAAVVYEDASRDYWRFSAERTVKRLGLVPGERVLDVACGTGAATIPAAVAVGPDGEVVAVDYAEPMLQIARDKASAAGLDNVGFEVADMTCLDLADESFDAVACVLGVFFVDDMAGLLGDLWRMVRPGGQLAVTTLGPRVFTPLIDEWRSQVAHLRGARDVRLPWERTDDPEVVAELFAAAGIDDVNVQLERNPLPLLADGDVWKLIMGTGLRSPTTELDDQQQTALREHLEAWITDKGVTEVDLDVIYATAHKHASDD